MTEYAGQSKLCSSCGRSFSYQKRWRNNWQSVRYCSGRCRRERLETTDKALEEAILNLLTKREKSATICPSEAARVITEDWQSMMERSRRAARRLVAAGKLEILQEGRRVDPSSAKGPIRLRLK